MEVYPKILISKSLSLVPLTPEQEITLGEAKKPYWRADENVGEA